MIHEVLVSLYSIGLDHRLVVNEIGLHCKKKRTTFSRKKSDRFACDACETELHELFPSVYLKCARYRYLKLSRMFMILLSKKNSFTCLIYRLTGGSVCHRYMYVTDMSNLA